MGAPVLIGVTGGSCSGKGYLCGRIRESLPPGRCVVLPLDAYYRDLSPLPPDERHRRNFDTPDALDHVLLHEHLEQAASGGVVDLPVYDFSTHTRLPRSERLDAGDKIVLVEGLFSLYWEGIRRFFSLGVFLDLDAETCLERRIERDVRERGRTPESVERQFRETVLPMYTEYVLPTRQYAGLVLRGDAPIEKSAARVLEFITG